MALREHRTYFSEQPLAENWGCGSAGNSSEGVEAAVGRRDQHEGGERWRQRIGNQGSDFEGVGFLANGAADVDDVRAEPGIGEDLFGGGLQVTGHAVVGR